MLDPDISVIELFLPARTIGQRWGATREVKRGRTPFVFAVTSHVQPFTSSQGFPSPHPNRMTNISLLEHNPNSAANLGDVRCANRHAGHCPESGQRKCGYFDPQSQFKQRIDVVEHNSLIDS